MEGVGSGLLEGLQLESLDIRGDLLALETLRSAVISSAVVPGLLRNGMRTVKHRRIGNSITD